MNRDDEQLRSQMRSYAACIEAGQNPPPASLIWLRAERRRRRLAVEWAERPVRMMQAVGLLGALLAAGWMLYRSAAPIQWPALGSAMMRLAIAAVLLVAAGCLAMVAMSRRPLT